MPTSGLTCRTESSVLWVLITVWVSCVANQRYLRFTLVSCPSTPWEELYTNRFEITTGHRCFQELVSLGPLTEEDLDCGTLWSRTRSEVCWLTLRLLRLKGDGPHREAGHPTTTHLHPFKLRRDQGVLTAKAPNSNEGFTSFIFCLIHGPEVGPVSFVVQMLIHISSFLFVLWWSTPPKNTEPN